MFKHGHNTRSGKHSPTYSSWVNMKSRCEDKNCPRYYAYGAIGVTFCEEWRTFDGFLAALGERPEGTTLGRFLDTGNYTPANCKWMTQAEQSAEKVKKAALIRGRAALSGAERQAQYRQRQKLGAR